MNGDERTLPGEGNLGSSAEAADSTDTAICGFWQRLLALAVDGLVLGVVGLALGVLFGSLFSQMGWYAKSVGFLIGMLYFGLMNSSIGNGQTLGKRLTHIRVVGERGLPISLGRSVCRYVALDIPFYLNGIVLPPYLANPVVTTAIGLVIFVWGGGIVYYYVFNRRTRQSLHDLVCRTYVVADTHAHPITLRPASVHYRVFAAYTLVVITVLLVVWRLVSQSIVGDLIALEGKLQENSDLLSAKVSRGSTRGPSGNFQFVAVEAISRGQSASDERVAEEIAGVVLDGYPAVQDVDRIEVAITHGYDIGIPSSWRTYTDTATPRQWETRLAGRRR